MKASELLDRLHEDAARADKMAFQVQEVMALDERLRDLGAVCSVGVVARGDTTRVVFSLDLVGVSAAAGGTVLFTAEAADGPGEEIADPMPPALFRRASRAETVATAEPVEPAPETPAELITGALSEAEKARTVALVREGLSASEIADRLGRARKGFHLIVHNLMAGEKAASPAAKPVAPAAKPAAPQDSRVIPGTEAFGLADWKVFDLLKKRPDGWCFGDDLALVEGLGRGQKLGELAADLGMDAEWLRDRYRHILPDTASEAQARLIKVLKVLDGAQAKVAAE